MFAKGGKYGYLDRTGKIVIEPQFEYAEPFFEGRAFVEFNGKPAFTDMGGNIVAIPNCKPFAMAFSDGLRLVKATDKFGYFDKSGKMAIPPAFDDAGSFSEGMAAVKISPCTRELLHEGILIC